LSDVLVLVFLQIRNIGEVIKSFRVFQRTDILDWSTRNNLAYCQLDDLARFVKHINGYTDSAALTFAAAGGEDW
jgi:hypothetical protein